MIVEIIYMVILLILIKVPFDLVSDIGLDYIEIFSTNNVLRVLWQLAFMLLYTVTLVCTLLVLLRNFNKKYRNNQTAKSLFFYVLFKKKKCLLTLLMVLNCIY